MSSPFQMQKHEPVEVGQTTIGRMYWVRTILAGLFLVAFAVGYLAIIYPRANIPEPGAYRFTFGVESMIYTVFIALYSIHFIYRLIVPKLTVPAGRPLGPYNIIGIILKLFFVGTVSASYLTGAMISTPSLFEMVRMFLGQGPVTLAINYHAFSASGIIVALIAYLVYELVSIGLRRTTFRAWLYEYRYPWIKVLWWALVIGTIIQGTIGAYLLGTVSPYGPYSFLGSNAYFFEDTLRHIHGPMSGVLIALIYGHIYFRIRPEYHLR